MSEDKAETRHLRAVPVGQSIRPYGLPPRMERDVVFWCCTSPRFWTSVGSLVDPGGLAGAEAKLVLEHIRRVVKECGKPPEDPALVLGSMVRAKLAGKLDPMALEAAHDFIEEAEGKHDSEDSVRGALAPIVQRRKQSEYVDRLVKTHMRHEDVSDIVAALQAVEGIGRDDADPGMQLGSHVFQSIDRLRHVDRLPLGIGELDMAIEGGLGRSQLCAVMGKSGDGKSMFLVNAAAKAICCGLDVAVGSLELEKEIWIARLLANLTGVPTNDILHGQWKRAEAKLAQLQSVEGFGRLIVNWFPPRSTKWSEVRRWFATVREEWGNLDVFITDYADKILPDERHDGTYGAMGEVYEEHRLCAVEWGCWALTASQKKSGINGKADVDDASDSANKGRVTDMMLDLEAQEDGTELIVRVVKNRHGPSRMEIGPLITDFARSRVSSVDVHPESSDPAIEEETGSFGSF